MTLNILIVDDEVANRIAIDRQLRNLGKILQARGDREVAEHLQQLRTKQQMLHLAVVDLRLGSTEGFQVIERIQREFPDAPVIILTVRNDIEAWRRAKSLRSVRYHITKPWWSKDLVAAAEECFSGKINPLKVIGTIEGAGDED